MNDYTQIIDTLSRTLEWLGDQAEMVPSTVPEFHEVRRRKVLFDKYGEAVQQSYQVADALSRAYITRSQMKKLVRATRLDKETPQSLIAPIRSQLEHLQSSLEDIIQALLSKKDGVDSVVRFYGSVQYILGSPRLEGLSE